MNAKVSSYHFACTRFSAVPSDVSVSFAITITRHLKIQRPWERKAGQKKVRLDLVFRSIAASHRHECAVQPEPLSTVENETSSIPHPRLTEFSGSKKCSDIRHHSLCRRWCWTHTSFALPMHETILIRWNPNEISYDWKSFLPKI